MFFLVLLGIKKEKVLLNHGEIMAIITCNVGAST